MIEINKLIAWLDEKANKSTTWYERTAYKSVIDYLKKAREEKR